MFAKFLGFLLGVTCPADPAEWESFVTWACRHEFGAFICYHLEHHAGSDCCVPPSALGVRLRYTRYGAQAVSLMREQVWSKLLTALETAGIAVLVLKGAALAYTVYPEPLLRPMGDIDLLIKPADLSQITILLKGLGFCPKPEPQQRINPFNTGWTGELSFQREYEHAVMSVDLHWELFATEWLRRVTRVNIESIWQQAVPFQIGHINAHTLSPEDMLFHICLHLSLHGFAHLRGYVDIMQLLEQKNLDWSLFLQRVRAHGLCAACYFPLWWIAQYRPAMPPKEVLAALKPDPLRTALGKWLVKQGIQREPDTGHAWNHVTQLLIVDHIADYGRLFGWLLFPGRVWLQERYHLQAGWRSWVWIFIHPFIVLREGIASFWTLLKQWVSHKH